MIVEAIVSEWQVQNWNNSCHPFASTPLHTSQGFCGEDIYQAQIWQRLQQVLRYNVEIAEVYINESQKKDKKKTGKII